MRTLICVSLVFLAAACGNKQGAGDQQVDAGDPWKAAGVENVHACVCKDTKLPAEPTMTAEEIAKESAAKEKVVRIEQLKHDAIVNGAEEVRSQKLAYCGFAVRNDMELFWDKDLKYRVEDISCDTNDALLAVLESPDDGPHVLLVQSGKFAQYYKVYAARGDITRDPLATEYFSERLTKVASTTEKEAEAFRLMIYYTQTRELCPESVHIDVVTKHEILKDLGKKVEKIRKILRKTSNVP